MASSRSTLDEMFRQIRAVIRAIPRGRVSTYGEVAELAGIPGGARIAAAALKTSDGHLPWQRVIGKAGPARGRIAIRDPIGAAMQRALLEKERVTVDERGFVDLRVYGLHGLRAQGLRAGRGRGGRPPRPPRSASTRRASSSRR